MPLFRRFWLPLCLILSVSGRAQEAASDEAMEQPAQDEPAPPPAKPVAGNLELQVELHRRGFSCGSIDGVPGAQTAAAIRGFQQSTGLSINGLLDKETKAKLTLSAPALTEYIVTSTDVASVHPVPETWLEKSERESMAYGTVLELVAEKFRAHPNLIKRLNPAVDWSKPVLPGLHLQVPNVERANINGTASRIVIFLAGRRLQVLDESGNLIAQFPVSIARMVEKRPVGLLHVVVVAPNPDYTFDPELFSDSPEAKTIGHKLIIPPGPNNPVGVVWIGLDRPGYGIHGTPEPENVGRTESHGCFRLANWDAETLLSLVQVGIPVEVQP